MVYLELETCSVQVMFFDKGREVLQPMWPYVLLVVLILIFIIGLFIGNYFFSITLDRDNTWYSSTGSSTVNAAAKPNPIVTKANKTMDAQYAEAEKFWDKYTVETPTITSFDGLELYGRVIKSNPKSNKWAICMHGYRSSAFADCAYPVVMLQKYGINTLAPDQRSHGQSEGQYIGMGWHERNDVQDWIQYLIKKQGAKEILLYGGSMGAATVMNTAGENLPKQVKAIIADCGYTSAANEFAYVLNTSMNLPKEPIMFFANLVTLIRARYSLYKDSPMKQLRNNDLPALFYHGTSDGFIPFPMSAQNAFSTQGPKELHFVEHATHFTSYTYDPDRYFDIMKEFLDNYFLK